MAEVFVDTSFVVALVNKNDQNHGLAMDLAGRLTGQGLVTTDAILLEIGNALSRNFKRQSVEIIEEFLTSDDVQVIHLHPPLFRRAFDLYKSRSDKVWGLIDCVSFVVMKELGITDALSADKHFEQAGFNILIRA
ncbi:MAG TPA: PIN domain-containing protein [Pyrinomonadaceae bacterium]|nr:PIN domain-containing protein [Pyrinomonadaceae bacterium]